MREETVERLKAAAEDIWRNGATSLRVRTLGQALKKFDIDELHETKLGGPPEEVTVCEKCGTVLDEGFTDWLRRNNMLHPSGTGITPEMLEAGADVLSMYDSRDCRFWEAAEAVFKAMVRAREEA